MKTLVTATIIATILTFGVVAQDATTAGSSSDELWVTSNHYVAANYRTVSTVKRFNTVTEAAATLDLGNGKTFTLKYMSLSDFLEDAWRHGMSPVSFIPKTDDTVTIVLSNSRATR